MQKFQKEFDDKLETVHSEVSQYREEVIQFKNELAEKIDDVKKEVASKPSNARPHVISSPTKLIKEATKEIQARTDRKNDIMLFNVPEPETNIKTEVSAKDKAIFSEICDFIGAGLVEGDVSLVKRIGAKKKEKKIIDIVNDRDV